MHDKMLSTWRARVVGFPIFCLFFLVLVLGGHTAYIRPASYGGCAEVGLMPNSGSER